MQQLGFSSSTWRSPCLSSQMNPKAQAAPCAASMKPAMLILADLASTASIPDQYIRALVQLRFQQLGHFDPEEGVLLVVEIGDRVEDVEKACGLPILHDPFSDVPLGHPDYSPSFDYIEAHYANGRITCFEAHADTGDAGIGTTLFVPAEEGIPASLLALCTTYAVPATALMES